MSAPTIMKSLIKSLPHLLLLILNLLWIYSTLGLRVRKTRRAFEKQLIGQGMSKEDAQRLSAYYKKLSNNITGMIKQNIRFRRFE